MKYELREVEVKLHTPDLDQVGAALARAGARLVKARVFERNIRYESDDRALSAAGAVLRLRQDDAATLAYKGRASVEAGIVSRFEAEVEVSDFATMNRILKRLGYQVAIVYEKYRTTYALDGVEIVLDELPFGKFTEIEGDAAAIERAILKLGLGGCRRMAGSYVDIFWDVKTRLGMVTRDCTFDNFVDTDVRRGS